MITTDVPARDDERRTLLKISGPLIAAYLAEMGMVITDMLIVGRLGSIELAAVGLGGDWFYVLLLIGIGVLSIVGVLMAQARGAGDQQRVMEYLFPGMVVATVLTIPISIMSWYLAPVLGLTNQDPLVLQRIDEYMKPLTFTVWPALIYVVLRNFLTALERTRSLMYLTLIGLVMNLLVNIVLVHGKLGFPALGVAGAGLGTTLVHVVMLLMLVHHLLRHRYCEIKDLCTARSRYWRARLSEIWILGFPISVSHLLSGGMFTVAAVMMGLLGADNLASQQLVYALIYCAISIAIGIGDAAKVRVAWGLGRHSPPAMAQSATQSLLFGGLVCVCLSLILWLFPLGLIGVFLNLADPDNASAIAIALSIAVYAGFFQVFDGLNVIASNALRGLRDTSTPMWTTLVCYWLIGLGLAWWLGFEQEMGAQGVWLGMLAGVGSSAVFLIWRFYRRIKIMQADPVR